MTYALMLFLAAGAGGLLHQLQHPPEEDGLFGGVGSRSAAGQVAGVFDEGRAAGGEGGPVAGESDVAEVPVELRQANLGGPDVYFAASRETS